MHEKIAFVQESRPNDEHILIIPGEKDVVRSSERSRIYSICSPPVSRATQYRALVNLRALDEIIERERPDIIESADPYQIGWKALRLGQTYRIPVVAFYHSHFVEAYLRRPAERIGARLSALLLQAGRSYVRSLYRRFAATLVPSEHLCHVLAQWGIGNTRKVSLGVNTAIFYPGGEGPQPGSSEQEPRLLYVGRLAAEKNTHTLFEVFAILAARGAPFHFVLVGDGQQRKLLQRLQAMTDRTTWIRYCAEPAELAQLYRSAQLLVHPGVEETFGLVALEAQACGTPVVGVRGSNMDEVILHDQSDWAAENTPIALAAAIERMSARADLRSLGSFAARAAAERYAWPRVFAHLFSIYEEVVASYSKT